MGRDEISHRGRRGTEQELSKSILVERFPGPLCASVPRWPIPELSLERTSKAETAPALEYPPEKTEVRQRPTPAPKIRHPRLSYTRRIWAMAFLTGLPGAVVALSML